MTQTINLEYLPLIDPAVELWQEALDATYEAAEVISKLGKLLLDN